LLKKETGGERKKHRVAKSRVKKNAEARKREGGIPGEGTGDKKILQATQSLLGGDATKVGLGWGRGWAIKNPFGEILKRQKRVRLKKGGDEKLRKKTRETKQSRKRGVFWVCKTLSGGNGWEH